jgi:hypothetical protein
MHNFRHLPPRTRMILAGISLSVLVVGLLIFVGRGP